VCFVDKEQSSSITNIIISNLFNLEDTTTSPSYLPSYLKESSYDMCVLTLQLQLGKELGYLGMMANARSDEFDIATGNNPIILIGLNSHDEVEY